jgi:hypothetical protein
MAHDNSIRCRNRFPCTASVMNSCRRSNTALGPSSRKAGMVLHGTAMNKGEDTFFLALSKSVRRSEEVTQRSLVVVECPSRTNNGRYLAPRRALSCIRDTAMILRFEAVRTVGPPAFADSRTTS